ncbi:hypothetical protein PYH56_12330 (plasmid) [Staphylococcus epidermidis]|uniref:hypothetical protein n=1 Tax=Staphylococcus epidermidis TaxID=1282 RepID=UPI0024AD6255|nr:hypothetical protein [Staphylococcus epidermidis]WHI82631.1 hypothetical protein PYH56_12330 [Staphylococcus epidermidis]
MIETITNKMKNTKLNVTSTIYIGIAMIIGELIPFLLFSVKKVDYMSNIFTTVIPTVFNVVLLSTYKIVSFYQEVDNKLVTSSKDKKYLKSKYIAYTEAILTLLSSVPTILWYIFLGFSLLAKYNITIAILSLLLSSLILLILFFITIIYCISKLTKWIRKKYKC